MTLDSPQRHHLVHSSSSYEIVGKDERVKTLIAERHPFKAVENYFTDSFL